MSEDVERTNVFEVAIFFYRTDIYIRAILLRTSVKVMEDRQYGVPFVKKNDLA